MPSRSPSMGKTNMTRNAHLYVAFIIALGLLSLIFAGSSWDTKDVPRFIAYAALAAAASTLKVRLPGIEGTFSADFLFILIGIMELGLAETVIIAGCCAIVQCVWNAEKRPTPIQVVFNVANLATSAAAAYKLYHLIADSLAGEHALVLFPLAASAYFATNTLIVSGILSILQRKSVLEVWQSWFLWSFPYYLVGSAIAGWMTDSNRHLDWKLSLLVLPVMYLAYVSYKLIVRQHRQSKVA